MNEFTLIKELGSGSFGKVYKVLKKKDKQPYAMKQIKMQGLSIKQKEQALNQVRILASIDSPSIIDFKGAFLDQYSNNLCIIMQYAEGGDLSKMIKTKKIKKQQFEQEFIWKIAYNIIKGLKILHENKIIHRDIKSGNVFLVNGVGKLGDMNVSKVLKDKLATTLTGTPFYISPQIWLGHKYDYKCDIWALGCILYELCMLRPPFMSNDFGMLIKKVQSGLYHMIPSTYSFSLRQLIKKCLTVNPAKRPTAGQLLKLRVMDQFQNYHYGQVSLLTTIKWPKILSALQQTLPQNRYTKVSTMKNIQQANQREKSKYSSKRCTKMLKIASQKLIAKQLKEKQNFKNKKLINEQLKLFVKETKIPIISSNIRAKQYPKKAYSKKIIQ